MGGEGVQEKETSEKRKGTEERQNEGNKRMQKENAIRSQRAFIYTTMREYLPLCGHLPGNEQPEETLRERFLATRSLGEQLLALGDAVATETNALGKEEGTH